MRLPEVDAVESGCDVLANEAAGGFTGTMDFGGGAFTSAGNDDIFVAKFDTNGNHLWSQRFGDSRPQSGRSLVVDGSGKMIVAGAFFGTVDFGGGPLTSAGDRDIFVVKFDPGTVPAALQAFESYWTGSHVEVAWRLIDVEGELWFEVFRMEGSGGSFVRLYAADVRRRGDEFIFEDHSTDPGKTYRYQVVIFEDGEAVTSFETTVATPTLKLALPDWR